MISQTDVSAANKNVRTIDATIRNFQELAERVLTLPVEARDKLYQGGFLDLAATLTDTKRDLVASRDAVQKEYVFEI